MTITSTSTSMGGGCPHGLRPVDCKHCEALHFINKIGHETGDKVIFGWFTAGTLFGFIIGYLV